MKVIRTIYPESEPILVIRNQTYGPNTDTPMFDEEMETWPEVIEAVREGKITIVEA
jgi:hypothetical protein